MDNIILVDSQNEILGVASKNRCHDGKGILHRAFSVFVFNENSELLLQKRAVTKRLWPGYWSNSCCSHPYPGESNLSATSRRLKEELGISCKKYSELYNFEYQASYRSQGSENELCFVVICRFDGTLAVNNDEVSETRWISLTDLEREIKNNPDQFTPWFKIEYTELSSTYIQRIKTICT